MRQLVVGPENLNLTALLLIWGQVGIGCPMYFGEILNRFGKKVSDYYSLQRLDPSYRVFYPNAEVLDIPAGVDALCELFEKVEKGSSEPLKKFIEEGKYKYEAGINDLVYKPGALRWRTD